MKERAIRILVLLWLGWYLSGPVCEALDFWDTSQDELQDIVFHASGALVLVAAVFCAANLLSYKLRRFILAIARLLQSRHIDLVPLESAIPMRLVLSAGEHSPPTALRI